jgi:hypothetical protein
MARLESAGRDDRAPALPAALHAGGETNPLGARALYLGKTAYRIHGTNQPSTIGTFVSSGCIRLTNEDVMDLYRRVQGRHARGGAAGPTAGNRRSDLVRGARGQWVGQGDPFRPAMAR